MNDSVYFRAKRCIQCDLSVNERPTKENVRKFSDERFWQTFIGVPTDSNMKIKIKFKNPILKKKFLLIPAIYRGEELKR